MSFLQHLQSQTMDGVVWLAGHHLKGLENDPIGKAQAVKTVAEMLGLIDNITVKEGYEKQVLAVYKDVKYKDLKIAKDAIEKEKRNKFQSQRLQDAEEDFVLPRAVLKSGGSIEMYENDILKYGVFIHANVIYSLYQERYFEKVSNFGIEIIQHMEDEKNPMKLVKMSNGEKQRTFDTPSKSFNSLQGFKEMLTNFGNYQFTGKQQHLDMLIAKLFDEMGDGRMITVLGWQPEGFWVFQNKVALTNGDLLDMDEYGCFDWDGSSYYTPSGNSIYQHKSGKFSSEKLAKYLPAKVSLEHYLKQMMLVHQERAMNAILHTFSTTFSDVIFDKVGFFPILFFYGEASTGKDNLIFACQSFYGKPQKALLLTGANTEKARVRVSAQFKNMIVNMREFINDPKIIEYLTGYWDRSGYTRGTIDSPFGTETISIDSSAMISSNEYPIDDALLTRLVVEEFMKNTFTAEEKSLFNQFTDIVQDGISSLLVDLIALRSRFETHYREAYKRAGAELRKDLNIIGIADRMIDNVSVYAATYQIVCEHIRMPFTYEEWFQHAKLCLERQARKRETGSVVQKFFEIFLDLVREKSDPILHHREFTVKGSELSFNFKQIYTRYAKTHRMVFNKPGLSQGEMMDKLKKSDAFVEYRKKERIGPGIQTSTLVFDINKTPIGQELLELLEWKDNERSNQSNSGWTDHKSKASGVDEEIPY